MISEQNNSQYRLTHQMRINLVFIALCLAFVLQLAGFVSPGWAYLRGTHITVHIGLWYRITCKASSECKTESMMDDKSIRNNEMLENQIETTIALVACIAAMTSFIVHRRLQRINFITVLMVGCLSSMLSGILSLIAAGKMGDGYLKRHIEQIDKYGYSVYKFPYSLVLNGVGGLIACLVSLCLVVETHLYTQKYQFRLTTNENQTVKYEQRMSNVISMSMPSQQYSNRDAKPDTREIRATSYSSRANSMQPVTQPMTKPGELFVYQQRKSADVTPKTIPNANTRVDQKGVIGGKQAAEAHAYVNSETVSEHCRSLVAMNDMYNM